MSDWILQWDVRKNASEEFGFFTGPYRSLSDAQSHGAEIARAVRDAFGEEAVANCAWTPERLGSEITVVIAAAKSILP